MQTEPVVTRYTADTGSLLTELEKIRSAQAKYGASVDNVVVRLDQQNKALEASIARWAKVGVGIAAVSVAIDKGARYWEEYGDKLRLTEAAAGVNIAALDKAVVGQLEHMDLLKLAAELNNGALKLTQEQMEDVAGAIRQLAREGEDATEVSKAFANFIGSGQTRALTQYGIGVDEAGKKTKNLSDIFGEISDRADKVEGATLSMGEAQQAVSNDVKDSFGRIRTAIGELVDGLAPLIQKFADLAEVLAKVPSIVKDIGTNIGEAFASLFMSDEEMMYAELEKQGRGGSGRPAPPPMTASFEIVRPGAASDDTKGKRGGRGGPTAEQIAQAEYEAFADARQRDADARREYAAEWEQRIADYYSQQEKLDAELLAKRQRMALESDAEVGAQLRASIGPLFDKDAMAADRAKTSKIESIFGPLEEINRYAVAFDMLTGAVSSAMGAWIDGSMSAGQAAKAFVAESLKSIAQLSIVEAIKNAAYGFAALAMGPIAGKSASQYFTASAMFGATAVAAGAGARAMGTGAAATSSATGTVGTGSSGGGSGRDRTIVIGDSFADDSPRMRQRKAQRLVALADREGGSAARYS